MEKGGLRQSYVAELRVRISTSLSLVILHTIPEAKNGLESRIQNLAIASHHVAEIEVEVRTCTKNV